MSAHRFFLEHDLPEGAGPFALPLRAEDVRHAVRSLRLQPTETIEVVEPDRGRCLVVEVAAVSPATVEGRVVGEVPLAPGTGITLCIGVAKGEKMDRIVRHCVELGVETIAPLITEHTVVRLDRARGAEKAARWQRIARAAAEQSRAPRIPRVLDPTTLGEAHVLLAEQDAVVVVWEESTGVGIAGALARAKAAPGSRVALVVGPEGGLSRDEVEALAAAGAVTATLGARILRTETAAVVSVALAMDALGFLGGRDG
jgi:16S rRNA (uracil1498-N3)-methyltransferase